MLRLLANVEWLQEQDGGLPLAPPSGVSASFSVRDDLIIARIYAMDEGARMARGAVVPVRIDLPYGQSYRADLSAQGRFTLHMGGRVLARGTVISLLE